MTTTNKNLTVLEWVHKILAYMICMENIPTLDLDWGDLLTDLLDSVSWSLWSMYHMTLQVTTEHIVFIQTLFTGVIFIRVGYSPSM